MSMLEFCLTLKTFQSAVNVLCQVSYLAQHNSIDDPTTTPQAKALFGLNIAFSMMTVIMSVIVLYSRESLLQTLESKRTIGAARADADIEMSHGVVHTVNPLHEASEGQSSGSAAGTHGREHELEMENACLDRENVHLQSATIALESENADLDCENTGLKAEITILQEKIKEIDEAPM